MAMIGPRGAMALALAGALAVSHLWAFRLGEAAERADEDKARAALQADLFDLADRHSQQAADLARLRAEQDQAQRDFEDAARSDPAAVGRRPDAVSLRDLEALWRGATGTP